MLIETGMKFECVERAQREDDEDSRSSLWEAELAARSGEETFAADEAGEDVSGSG